MIDKKYLPSKKFVIALSIAVVIILLAIIFNYWKPNTTKYKNTNLITDANASSAVMNLDSDNDGLPDWKEGLYGTNPKVADTDGDGTSDFDEISINRDPLKANTAPKGQEPNDKIDQAIIEENKKILEEYKQLNEMDRFSRNLVSDIIATQPVDGSMDQDSINEILAKALNEIPNKNFSGITKNTDLNLLKTTSENLNKNIANYTKAFSTETNKLIPLVGMDVNIINSYVLNGSTSSKTDMLKLTSKYQEIVNNLIEMPVPVTTGYYDISYHLEVINDLEIMIAIDKDIVNSSKDSLGIFTNLSIYNTVTANLFATLTTIDEILKIQR